MYLRSVRSKYLKIICYASEYFTRLTATLTFSSTLSIRHLMRRHVLLSNGLELQNSLWTHGFLLYIQLYCCLLFIVHEYWRNSTSCIASCHPLNVPLRRLLVVLTPLQRFHTGHFTPPRQGGGFTSR